MKITHKHIDHINKQMDRMKVGNVAIYIPNLTDKNIETLKKHFAVVRREFFGYVYFERGIRIKLDGGC